jgi:signal transduction histidine kinase/ActR/RegA family two-component response regulator
VQLLLVEADAKERQGLLAALSAAAPEVAWAASATGDEAEQAAFDAVVLALEAFRVILTDRNEKKAIESQLLRSQRLESLGTLAGGIAHDLNNVLTPIQLSLDLLRDAKTDEARRPLEAMIQANLDRGAHLIRQILLFARDPASKTGRVQESSASDPTQLQQVLTEVEQILSLGLSKSIAVEVRSGAGLAPVLVEAALLRQMLLNLGVNARDAMPMGGRLTITATSVQVSSDQARLNPPAKPGPHVLFTVTDTGEGMSAEILDRIFDPFFTTREPGKGAGLGLSAVFGLVKRHGGLIEVDSTLGVGSEFRVYLPAAPGAASSPPDVSQMPRGNNELILVIDDEEAIRHLARATLEAFNYRVLTAADGAEGVALFAAHQHDIRAVLTDMMMPVMDGTATIRALRRLDPKARIIASSGLLTPHSAELVNTRVSAFLPKPYSARKLLETLHAALRE